MKTKLPRFEGRDVQAASLNLTGRAHERVGALSLDEEVYLIIRGTVTRVSHQDGSAELDGMFIRNHVVRASAVILMDNDSGARILDEATMLADERFGIQNLFRKTDEGEG